LKEGEYIDALKLRANVYPTREASHRAHGTNPMCRRCGLYVETVGHISGHCPSVKKARIARHNKMLNHLEKYLKERGYNTWREPKFRDDERAYIPDLVALVPDSNMAMIIDPTVVWDTDGKALDRAVKLKVQKYLPIIPQVKELTGALTMKICPFVVGARGAWWRGNHHVLKRPLSGEQSGEPQTFPDRQVSHFCNIALVGTIQMLSMFMDM
jgi:hypothetical protein